MLCPALADLKTGESTVLAEGRDFYTSPRLNADSTKVTSRCMAGEYGRDHIKLWCCHLSFSDVCASRAVCIPCCVEHDSPGALMCGCSWRGCATTTPTCRGTTRSCGWRTSARPASCPSSARCFRVWCCTHSTRCMYARVTCNVVQPRPTLHVFLCACIVECGCAAASTVEAK